MNARNLLLMAAVLVAAGVLTWWLKQPRPAFDLDDFDSKIARLKAANIVAARTADTDTTTPQIELDRWYLGEVGAVLADEGLECPEAEQELRRLRREMVGKYQQLPESRTERPGNGDLQIPERRAVLGRLKAMRKLRRANEAQRIVAKLAPSWIALSPKVHAWANRCPEESKVLELVLGTKLHHAIP